MDIKMLFSKQTLIERTKQQNPDFWDFYWPFNAPGWCDSVECKFQGDRWHQQLLCWRKVI